MVESAQEDHRSLTPVLYALIFFFALEALLPVDGPLALVAEAFFLMWLAAALWLLRRGRALCAAWERPRDLGRAKCTVRRL